MAEGRLVPPNLDDRTWQEMVDEVRRLIPQYAPQWTDHNPSDLGITLVELFAWIVEGMIYRLNRVPEKHYIEFLNLLGIARDPATPASGHVTFTVTTAPTTTIPKGTKVATQQLPTEEPVVFETDAALEAVSINLTHMLYVDAALTPLRYTNYSQASVTGPLQATTLSVQAGNVAWVLLGFDGPSPVTLPILFDLAARTPEIALNLEWTYSQGGLQPDRWPPISPQQDGTESFMRSGTVDLEVPAEWQAQLPTDWTVVQPASSTQTVTTARFWLGLRVANPGAKLMDLTVRRVGFNSVSVTNALTVNTQGTEAEAEILGVSTGQPLQTFVLKHPPLYKQPAVQDPYGHLIVEVREPTDGGGFGPWVRWSRVEDFPPGDGEVYKCNPVTGDITFGNHDPVAHIGNGKVPRQGSQIRALTYRYVVGGVRGNVPPLAINVLREPVPGLVRVSNPGPATGGSDQETIEETKRRAPEVLKNRNRAVTLADYEYLAREASTDVRKVRALPELTDATGNPRSFGGLDRSPGHINVIIVPDAADARPRPTDDLLVEVSDYLQPRRTATVHLHVRGPRYLPIRVIATINVWSSAIADGLIKDTETYRDAVITKLQGFLHPTRGKQDGSGWEVGESVYVNQIFAAIQPSPEVGFIASIRLEAGEPDYLPPNRPEEVVSPTQGTWVRIADYEMVCYGERIEDIQVGIILQ